LRIRVIGAVEGSLSACGIQVAASSIWRFYNRHGISSTAQVQVNDQ
jgi:hypothetical protein